MIVVYIFVLCCLCQYYFRFHHKTFGIQINLSRWKLVDLMLRNFAASRRITITKYFTLLWTSNWENFVFHWQKCFNHFNSENPTFARQTDTKTDKCKTTTVTKWSDKNSTISLNKKQTVERIGFNSFILINVFHIQGPTRTALCAA